MSAGNLITFTPAEFAALRQKAQAAQSAINEHANFVAFLREQHNAPEEAGWVLTNRGFEVPLSEAERLQTDEPLARGAAGGSLQSRNGDGSLEEIPARQQNLP